MTDRFIKTAKALARKSWCWKSTPKRYLTLSDNKIEILSHPYFSDCIYVKTEAWGQLRTCVFSKDYVEKHKVSIQIYMCKPNYHLVIYDPDTNKFITDKVFEKYRELVSYLCSNGYDCPPCLKDIKKELQLYLYKKLQ